MIGTETEFLYSTSHYDKIPFLSETKYPQCFYHFRFSGRDLYFRKVRNKYEVYSTAPISLPPYDVQERYRLNNKEYLIISTTDFDLARQTFFDCTFYFTNLCLHDKI